VFKGRARTAHSAGNYQAKVFFQTLLHQCNLQMLTARTGRISGPQHAGGDSSADIVLKEKTIYP